MLHKLSRSSLAVQAVLLATCAFAFVILQQGIPFNQVMHNYYLGGDSFLKGQNPYETTLQTGPSNQFKNSPLLAVVTGSMAKSSRQVTIIGLWALTGIAAFAFGLSR